MNLRGTWAKLRQLSGWFMNRARIIMNENISILIQWFSSLLNFSLVGMSLEQTPKLVISKAKLKNKPMFPSSHHLPDGLAKKGNSVCNTHTHTHKCTHMCTCFAWHFPWTVFQAAGQDLNPKKCQERLWGMVGGKKIMLLSTLASSLHKETQTCNNQPTSLPPLAHFIISLHRTQRDE